MQQTAQVAQQVISGALVLGSLATWCVILSRRIRRLPLVVLEPRVAVPWSGLDVLLLTFATLTLDGLARQVLETLGFVDAGVTTAISVAGTGAALLTGWLFSVGYLRFKTGASAHDLGFSFEHVGYDVALGLAAFLAAFLPVYAVQMFFVAVLKIESQHPLITLMRERPAAGVLATIAVTATAVAPLVEEFSFRVVLQGWLEKLNVVQRTEPGSDPPPPGYAPLVVVSAIFGLLHFGHGPDPIALFVFSLFLGYVYRQTHRILAPLVVHMSLNGLTVLELCFEFAAAK